MAQVKYFLSDNSGGINSFRYFCGMKPDIYFFNPTCELAVANGSVNFMAPAQLRRFENEFSTLPWILARPEDFVLVDQIPSKQFTGRLESACFQLPSFRVPISSFSDPEFLSINKGFLFPWGWSPAAHKLLSNLKSGCSPEFRNSPVNEWRKIHRDLYSRKSALDVLRNITGQRISDHWLSCDDLPEICTEHEQVIALQQKWEKVVVKAPLSSSGRGLQVLRKNEYNQTNRQVITGYLKQQGFVVVGPWHNKLLDLSFQFFSHGNGVIEFRGLTSFWTDHSGRFTGNYLQELPQDLSPELNDFICQNIPAIEQALTKALLASEYSTNYFGWLGVDALIWKSDDGMLKFHPCLEINCRFTMGAIALKVRTHLAEQSAGEFRIMHGKTGQFAQFCSEMTRKEPLIIDGRKIASGFLPVTPTTQDGSFGAWISVTQNKE